MSLLKKANIITTPTAYSEGKLHSVKPEIALGPELVTNGDFATDGIPSTTSWSLGWYSQTSNVLISGGKLTLTNSASESNSLAYATDGVSSLNVVTINKTYKLQYRVIENNGVTSFKYYSAAGSFIVAPTDLGVTHTIYIKNTVNQIFLFQNATTNSSISIDNVSVKEDISADFDFTRGSTATRVNEAGLIESVAANLPRINYENGIGHLLLEPQRTSLITYSESFSNAYWSKTRCTINQNSIISPSGLLNASLLTATDTSENYIQSNVSTAVSGTKQVISCFVKKGTSDFTHLLLWDTSANGARQWFDLENGIIGTSTSFGSGISVDSASIEEYVNGWYRCIVVFNNSITPVRFRISASNGDGDFNSSIGKTIYIWGYQLEEGSYPTSYIVSNSGSATTRLAEVCNGSGNASTFNSSEGVLMAQISALADDVAYRFISLSDGTLSNRVSLFLSNINTLNGSADGVSSIASVADIKNNNKVAYKYKSGDYSLWVNGFEEGTLTVTTGNHANLNRLNFDYGQGSNDFYGKTKQIAYFPEALTDSELECLTSWSSFNRMAIDLNYTIQ